MPESPAAKILIVDDDPATVELIANLFRGQYETLFALSGEKALEIAASAIPDLILLDLMLPGMDGFAVCAQLKADPLTSAIPVLFITGRADSTTETRALELGAMDYITKPINPLVLKIRVRNQIELKQARDRLAKLATTDGLTGIANRRRFDEVLAQEHARHARTGTQLGLIMLDIDHFKAYNDTYGHVLGDDCLCAVAQVLERGLRRNTDLVARYGGEEFACVLVDGPPAQGALALAEALRKQVAALAVPHKSSPTAEYVTISLGIITACCNQTTDASLLIRQADEQLYRAKNSGRNRSCLAKDLNC
ncbi:diguanylate cyclase domain-containing protein [Halochromatium roseum]|uniref:diguanylate cyclase domain-containing protein n=1 Tax=Halochromatium roseum TaxID=391920 RepID=UPI001914230F|nr:diguanylate cyclase [Halochromatium roseum]MBK5939901.1 diguanylate cyclase response regulator [Halochromatium roseum]